MMKLFAVYVVGEASGANIEVHDMRFVAAASIAETYDELRRQWWGTPSSLHVDCWAEIESVDGFDVTLRPEPFAGEDRLYYVNLGGYDRNEFLEKHRNVFVVAKSLKYAKMRALASGTGWKDLHRDDLYEAEQAFALERFDGNPRLHIHLEPAHEMREVVFTCRYTPIGKGVTDYRQAHIDQSSSAVSLRTSAFRTAMIEIERLILGRVTAGVPTSD